MNCHSRCYPRTSLTNTTRIIKKETVSFILKFAAAFTAWLNQAVSQTSTSGRSSTQQASMKYPTPQTYGSTSPVLSYLASSLIILASTMLVKNTPTTSYSPWRNNLLSTNIGTAAYIVESHSNGTMQRVIHISPCQVISKINWKIQSSYPQNTNPFTLSPPPPPRRKYGRAAQEPNPEDMYPNATNDLKKMIKNKVGSILY